MLLSSFWNLNLPTDPQIWGIFSWQHLMMLGICLIITFSLYIFPKQYAYLSRTNYFLYIIVAIQMFFLIFLKTIQIINIPKYQVNHADWTGVFPLNYCAITQIFSIILVFWRNNKFFSSVVLFPIFGSWLTILMPSEKEILTTNADQMRFYEFFMAHYLSFFIPFFLYLFGKRKYYPEMWKVSVSGLFILAMFDFILNATFATNFIFIGPNQAVGPIDFRLWLNNNLNKLGSFLNTMFVVFVMGFGGFWGMYFLLNYLIKPLYIKDGKYKLHNTWIIFVYSKIKFKFFSKKFHIN